MSNKLTKNEIKLLGTVMAPFAAILITLGALCYPAEKEKANQRQEEERKEVRAKQFAEYIVSEVSKAAQNPELSNWSIEYYKRDPKGAERLMKELEADSTKYADAIFRDAGAALIGVGDRSDNVLTFQEAAARLAQHGFEPMGPGPVSYTGVAHRLDVNRKHLKDTSLELAAIRKAKSMAD